MARPLRIEFPGAFYHVISRGNAGEPIYSARRDRKKFLNYLGTSVSRFGIRIHTYCLMANHYHLLVETPEPNLSRAIQWLNVSYATYFNKKRGRQGHLFQGRFKSILVDADAYLKQVSRYVHLNPVRAKLVDTVVDHEWSSYPAFIGKTKAPEWLCVDWLLDQFGDDFKIAQHNYRQYVEGVDSEMLRNPSKKVVSGAILGDDKFVVWVKKNHVTNRSDHPELPQLKELKPRCSLDRIIEVVADVFECSRDQILEKGRKKNLARDISIYFSRNFSGKSGVEIAHRYGMRSGAATTMRYKAALKKLEDDRELALKVQQVKKRMMNN